MVHMARVTINWSGFAGGPGSTNFYFRDITGGAGLDQTIVDSAVSKVDALLTAIKPSIPSGVTVGVDSTVEAIEDTTGDLISFWDATPNAAGPGTGTSTFIAPVGVVFTWYTSTVRNSRRIRGRNFFVPLSTVAYDADGTINSARMTTFNNAASAFVGTGASAEFGIWSRPSGPGATDGQWALVTSFRIPDMGAVLTSRRN